ncbi:MAG: acyltransferase [Clostridia bacterium]|nr:acyltransferase [Clostridia bacterium]
MLSSERLNMICNLIDGGLNSANAAEALFLIGFEKMDAEELATFKLWNEYMPLAKEYPYTEEQRNLHILWECLDKTPYAMNCEFAIPLRQAVAKKLFKKCGEGFVANENCKFNFANRIEIGDNVSWNSGCYIDAKGGVKMGDFAMLTENVTIFTHTHSEHDHMQRTYSGVEIGDYAKVYTAATVLPGVHIGKGAVVATGAIVTKDVEEFTLVAGIPAKPLRKRNFEGENLEETNQFMMGNREFQKYEK